MGNRATFWRRGLDWLLFFLVAALFLHGWLKPGLPTGPREEMIPRLTYIWMLRRQMEQGFLFPEWNPYEFAGFPWVRYFSFPLYYALAALSFLPGVSMEGAYKACYVICTALSALTMYEYVWHLRRQRWAALVAGLIYGFFPFHLHATIDVLEHAAFWPLLPLPFLLYEKGKRGLAALLLGCFPIVDTEHVLVTVPFVFLYFLWREGEGLLRGERSWRETLRFLGLTVLAVGGLSAFFVLPGLLEMPHVGIAAKFGQGVMRDRDMLIRLFAASPSRFLIAAIERLHLRVVSIEELRFLAWPLGRINVWYLGLVAVALTLVSLKGWRKSPVRLGWGLLSLSLLLSFGLATWLGLPLIAHYYPFFWMIMVAFFVALLAGLGVAELPLEGKGLARTLLGGMLVLLVIGDYYRPISWIFYTTPSYFHAQEVEAYRWIKDQGGDFRLWEFAYWPRQVYRYTYSVRYTDIPRWGGYFDNGAPLPTWQLFFTAFPEVEKQLSPLSDAALDLASVRYALFRPKERYHRDVMEWLLSRKGWRIAREWPHVVVLENANYRPMVRLYYSVRTSPTCSRDELSLLVSLEEDTALVCGDVSPPVSMHSPSPSGEVAWERPGPEEIRARVATEGPALLVVAESWYPNWHVYVDGEEKPLLRANYAFMGVWVEEGEHQVVFRYQRPWYVWASYAVSLTTLMAMSAWFALQAVKGRRKRSWEKRSSFGEKDETREQEDEP